MQPRNALQRTKIDINLLGVLRGASGSGRGASTADSDVESLEIVGEVGEDKAIVGADLAELLSRVSWRV